MRLGFCFPLYTPEAILTTIFDCSHYNIIVNKITNLGGQITDRQFTLNAELSFTLPLAKIPEFKIFFNEVTKGKGTIISKFTN